MEIADLWNGLVIQAVITCQDDADDNRHTQSNDYSISPVFSTRSRSSSRLPKGCHREWQIEGDSRQVIHVASRLDATSRSDRSFRRALRAEGLSVSTPREDPPYVTMTRTTS